MEQRMIYQQACRDLTGIATRFKFQGQDVDFAVILDFEDAIHAAGRRQLLDIKRLDKLDALYQKRKNKGGISHKQAFERAIVLLLLALVCHT
jgi:hypothetical protein